MDLVVISISVWHGINVLYYIILDEERNAKFVRLNKCVRVLYWALPKCCSINDDCDDDNRSISKKGLSIAFHWAEGLNQKHFVHSKWWEKLMTSS